MQGVLLVDKPAGWTSFDVVNYVRKIARQAELVESYEVYRVHKAESEKAGTAALDFINFQLTTPLPKVKVGHTGTLDPFATGLLVLLVGKDYTKRAGELSKLDKTYEVTLKLGEVSSTGDPEGEITPFQTPVQDRSFADAQDDGEAPGNTTPTPEQLQAALNQFTGPIEQIPPVFSAIKINGVRAYKLAREGKEVTIEPRQVTVYGIRLTAYGYPEVKMAVDVSSGTYIRTLVEDIGKALGTGAYTLALRRTAVGEYSIEDALNPTNLVPEALAAALNTF